MPQGQAQGSHHHCGACEDRYGPLRITVASVMLCLALAVVAFAEFIAVQPGDELKLMKDTELQWEYVSTCRASIEARETGDTVTMGKAARYTSRISQVLRSRHDGHVQSWEAPLLKAMIAGDLAGCVAPSP